jgi:CHRD domain
LPPNKHSIHPYAIMNLSFLATALFAALLSVVAVNAQTKTFFTLMNPAQQTTACASSSTLGNAVFTLVGTKLCMRLAYGKLFAGNETSSSINGPALIGASASKIFSLTGKQGKIDCLTLSSTQVTYLTAGKLYVTINSATCSGGETRGQILPVTI